MSPRHIFFTSLVALLIHAPVRGASAAEEPDLQALLLEGAAVQRKDLETWREYSFRREVHRERLDKRGEVEWRLDFVLRVTPSGSGFDEQLIELKGRAPTVREIDEHRKASRFTRQYKNVLAGKVDHVLADDRITLPAIFEASEYSYGGVEIINGVPCHRIEFEPQADRKLPITERLAGSIEGTFWLTVDGSHLAQWQTHLVRPVSRGLVKLKELDLNVTGQPVGDAFLPEVVEMYSVVNLGTGEMRKRNRYRYSEFSRASGAE